MVVSCLGQPGSRTQALSMVPCHPGNKTASTCPSAVLKPYRSYPAAKGTELPSGAKAKALSDPGVVVGIWGWSLWAPERPFLNQCLSCGSWIPSARGSSSAPHDLGAAVKSHKSNRCEGTQVGNGRCSKHPPSHALPVSTDQVLGKV